MRRIWYGKDYRKGSAEYAVAGTGEGREDAGMAL